MRSDGKDEMTAANCVQARNITTASNAVFMGNAQELPLKDRHGGSHVEAVNALDFPRSRKVLLCRVILRLSRQ